MPSQARYSFLLESFTDSANEIPVPSISLRRASAIKVHDALLFIPPSLDIEFFLFTVLFFSKSSLQQLARTLSSLYWRLSQCKWTCLMTNEVSGRVHNSAGFQLSQPFLATWTRLLAHLDSPRMS